jgi:hypothetical protein
MANQHCSRSDDIVTDDTAPPTDFVDVALLQLNRALLRSGERGAPINEGDGNHHQTSSYCRVTIPSSPSKSEANALHEATSASGDVRSSEKTNYSTDVGALIASASPSEARHPEITVAASSTASSTTAPATGGHPPIPPKSNANQLNAATRGATSAGSSSRIRDESSLLLRVVEEQRTIIFKLTAANEELKQDVAAKDKIIQELRTHANTADRRLLEARREWDAERDQLNVQHLKQQETLLLKLLGGDHSSTTSVGQHQHDTKGTTNIIRTSSASGNESATDSYSHSTSHAVVAAVVSPIRQARHVMSPSDVYRPHGDALVKDARGASSTVVDRGTSPNKVVDAQSFNCVRDAPPALFSTLLAKTSSAVQTLPETNTRAIQTASAIADPPSQGRDSGTGAKAATGALLTPPKTNRKLASPPREIDESSPVTQRMPQQVVLSQSNNSGGGSYLQQQTWQQNPTSAYRPPDHLNHHHPQDLQQQYPSLLAAPSPFASSNWSAAAMVPSGPHYLQHSTPSAPYMVGHAASFRQKDYGTPSSAAPMRHVPFTHDGLVGAPAPPPPTVEDVWSLRYRHFSSHETENRVACLLDRIYGIPGGR